MATSIDLTPEIERRLEALSARTGRSKALNLQEIIERGLEDAEDYYLAHAAMERLKRGEDEVVSDEEFWRGMED